MNDNQIQHEDWEDRYRNNQTPWDRGRTSPALDGWITSGVIEGSRILVPGCGRGHEVIELARRGFDVCGIDLSTTALQELSNVLAQNELSAELIESDFLAWQPEQGFDAVYEQTSMCAINPEHWKNYVEQLRSWLNPGGLLMALFMQTGRTGGPPWHCDLVTMQRLFKPPMWHWRTGNPERIEHPSGLVELAALITRH